MTFTLPAGWGPGINNSDAVSGGATWLHFEGVFQATDVFVNGKFVLRHTWDSTSRSTLRRAEALCCGPAGSPT